MADKSSIAINGRLGRSIPDKRQTCHCSLRERGSLRHSGYAGKRNLAFFASQQDLCGQIRIAEATQVTANERGTETWG